VTEVALAALEVVRGSLPMRAPAVVARRRAQGVAGRGRFAPPYCRGGQQPDRRPARRGIVLTVRDVEDRKAFEEQLRHRAFHDR
jgi:hypothetical protein